MCHPRTVALLLALVTFLVLPTLAPAQVLRLRACNRGSVPVEVIVAHAQGTFVYSWLVDGQTIAPGWCNEFPGPSLEALIAFGARDPRGRFVSLKPTTLPDMGDRATTLVELAQTARLRTPVLSRDDRTICASPADTYYSTEDTHIPTPAECTQLSLPGADSLVPVTTSYFVSAPEGVLGTYHVNVRASPDRGEVTMTVADNSDRDIADAASVPATANTPRMALLLGRNVTRSTGGRWLFDDGSEAFRDNGLPVPDTFFDVPPKTNVSITPGDTDRLVAIVMDVVAVLKQTDVRVNITPFSEWGDRGRLCFAWGGNIRCANVVGLDLDATTFTEGGVMFHCRGTGGCAFIAAPWTTTSDSARVRLDGRDWTLSTPQTSLFVSHLPNLQAARTLAARFHELGEIVAKYEEIAR
jgi:hypothetical protein